MGATSPYLSDEPGYTMVESGNCRCMCHGEYQDHQEQASGCCSPHVFTSVLLGILSCVLMTGGVFLAFNRWDPMWLMVSGVGVVLILIGTILHCCNNMPQRSRRFHSGKGCCARPLPPDHVGHLVPNNSSLTEQLLPLSNARSVSQLSLNMLPGYFPPVVTAYGIEQHSAVVQNINRLVQHQQSQNSASSTSPVGNGSTAGKSFIVLSLPNDTAAANVQNLVATVYQLDGNSSEVTATDACSVATSPVSVTKPVDVPSMLLKNAEVQTCNIWPVVAPTSDSVNCEASSSRSTSVESSCPPVLQSSQPNSETTQTEPPASVSGTVNLMDCSPDPVSISENSSSIPVTSPVNCTSVNTVESSEIISIERTENEILEPSINCINAGADESSSRNVSNSPSNIADDNAVSDSPQNPQSDVHTVYSEILFDVSVDTNTDPSISNSVPLPERFVPENLSNSNVQTEVMESSQGPTGIDQSQTVEQNDNLTLDSLHTELSDSSIVDTEIDDSEILERSSPPPSYEELALEGENAIGAFGLAYGTI